MPNFAQTASPLTDLLKQSNEFIWTKEREEAFNTLKQNLLRVLVLKVYNPKAWKTELHTDASSKGIGAILLQADREDDPLRMIYAVNRRTRETEEKFKPT